MKLVIDASIVAVPFTKFYRKYCVCNYFFIVAIIVQDRTVLSYLAYVLDIADPEVVELALSILEIFTKNVENYVHVTSTFGVREALDAVINKYSIEDPKLVAHAQSIKVDIERMKPPIYNLRSRCRRVIEPKKLKTHVIVLHVHGLLPVSFFSVFRNIGV